MLLASCTNCLAVKGEGSWYTLEGSLLKSTEKLSRCSKCQLDSYCDSTCQKKDFKAHKISCQTSPKKITAQEVDNIVLNQSEVQSGKVVLYLNAQKQFVSFEVIEPSVNDPLQVDVKIGDELVGRFKYLRCRQVDFDWSSSLEAILNPPKKIYNPGAQVELGIEMVNQGLYLEAFKMMAEKAFENYKDTLQDMFFRRAVKQMNKNEVENDLIVKCAKLLNRNRFDVEALIKKPGLEEIPQELQDKIDSAKELGFGKRDSTMSEIAKEVFELGQYDLAFGLVFDWVPIDCFRTLFFRYAVEKMIPNGVEHEKIEQLARTIDIEGHKFLNEVVGVYARNEKVNFACHLAKNSDNPDYFYEIVFSALLNIDKKEEAKKILDLVSPAKKRDLIYFVHD